MILGHNHPEVQGAVPAALRPAVCQAPFWSSRQLALVERLTTIIPGAEMAFLLGTGSDATSCAVRIARIVAGRSRVVRTGYNGWHDWSSPRAPGIPAAVQQLRAVVPVGYINSMAAGSEAAGTDLAAAIVTMPNEHEVPDPDYVRAVGTLATRAGAPFVLDEVRSSFRIALGGAQEAMGVRADLVCLRQGHSQRLLDLCGHRRRRSSPAPGGDQGFINLFRQPCVGGSRAGHHRRAGTDPTLRSHRVARSVAGCGTEFRVCCCIATARNSGSPSLAIPAGVRRGLGDIRGEARRGASIHPNHQWFISAMHTDADVDLLIDAVTRSIATLG